MKRYALAMILLAGIAEAGNTGAVEGTVVDSQTGKVIANVRVAIACGAVRRSTLPDGAGHFSFSDLPEGACTLSIGGGAYATSTLGVTVSSGSIATLLVNVTSQATLDQQEAARKKYEKERTVRLRVQGAVEMEDPAPMAGAPAPSPPAMHAPAMQGSRPPTPIHAAPRMPPPPPAGNIVAARAPAAPRVAVAGKAELAPNKNFKQDQQRRIHRQVAIGGEQVNGWATVRVFPVPQYTAGYEGPRDDFRETIYWNPAVETNAQGDADVHFVASDAVTAFRATAEGFAATGTPGGGDTTFQSKLPLTLEAHLPVEVTSGDTIRLPITLSNETGEAIDADLATTFGTAFRIATPVAGKIHLAPHAKQSVFAALDVVATEGSAEVALALRGRGLSDEMTKTIRVVPRGFPLEVSGSGTAKSGVPAHHTFELAGALPGTVHAMVTMYPSPVAAMTQGMAGMIREPGGCFEQTSSTNYPNIMVLAYLGSNDAADPALLASAREKLDHGYKLLTGYETPEKGYEWFGKNPGHEALTAYGLMEFADMAKVYDVDKKMVERTADWLMTRRDHKGSFLRSTEALDSFGRASETTTTAYIMWALAEAKRTSGMVAELGTQQKLGGETRDPYLLALAANTNLLTGGGKDMIARLAGMQAKDGGFPGAKETITMSGGESLEIETTALATLALIKASPNNEYEAQIRAAADWLNTKRSGYGAWGNTQATILGLKALTAYSEHARQMAAGGKATLVVNGVDAGTIAFEKGRRDALVWNDFAGKLTAGKNTIEVRLDGQAALPYSIAIDYRSTQPQTSKRAKIAITTQLMKTQAKMGDAVTLRAHVENTTNAGVPMTLARVGLPGGMVFQTWQLKELRDKGLIDFYETRPREVILYWRALAPNAKKDIDLNLLSAVPGTYEAPASSAYLYYTAEDKTWTKPVAVSIKE